jgi:SagB-type dehydrogenase family enzyme
MSDGSTAIGPASVRVAARIYGSDEVPLDDPAAQYHEASKLYPAFGARMTRGGLLASDFELQASSARSVRRHAHLPAESLPQPEPAVMSLGEAIEARRSERDFARDPIASSELAGLLHAAYGRTHQLLDDEPAGIGPQLRTVPSGGALFPLELYVCAWRVDGLTPGLYHFDPLRRVLECVSVDDLADAVAAAAIYPEPTTRCAALLLVTGVFWRTRFKYGLRGYRFALLEAGHVVQNVLLVATAYGLASLPLAGFYDARLESVLGVDGVEESVLYAVAVGRRLSNAS